MWVPKRNLLFCPEFEKCVDADPTHLLGLPVVYWNGQQELDVYSIREVEWGDRRLRPWTREQYRPHGRTWPKRLSESKCMARVYLTSLCGLMHCNFRKGSAEFLRAVRIRQETRVDLQPMIRGSWNGVQAPANGRVDSDLGWVRLCTPPQDADPIVHERETSLIEL